MKKRTKIFHFGLYLEGMKRLRVIGLALAILFVSISVIIPIYQWIEVEQSVDAPMRLIYEVTLDRMTISIPSVVASYLAPLFVFVIFSYLNKRKDSDFYHAIPFTRTCVFVSFMASALTWGCGILLLSSLCAAATWAISPYATFALAALLEHLLIVFLNALLLCAVAGAAVSLMGTASTALLAFGVLAAIWRFVLLMAMLVLEDISDLVIAERVLGGYLSPSFLLPVSIATESVRAVNLWYAAVVSLGFLVLGGVCYAKRNSEIAGRSVSGKWRHTALRCLLTLPLCLAIVYVNMTNNNGPLTMVLVVLMLLVFYLYELLTTRSVRGMLRATPWLGVVVAAGVLFGGAVLAGDAVVKNERIAAEDIVAVGFEESRSTQGLNAYETYLISQNLSRSEQVKHIVAQSFAQTQSAARAGDIYPTGSYNTYTYVYMELHLKSGATVVRRVRFHNADYEAMLMIIRDELDIAPLPDVKHVTAVELHMDRYDYSVLLSREDYAAVARVACEEWRALSQIDKEKLFNYGSTKENPLMLVVRASLGKESVYLQMSPTDATPKTQALLRELLQRQLPTDADLSEFLSSCEKQAHEAELSVIASNDLNSTSRSYYYFSGDDIPKVTSLIAAYAEHRADAAELDQSCVVVLRLYNYNKVYLYEEGGYSSSIYAQDRAVAAPDGYHAQTLCLLLKLDQEQLDALGEELGAIGKEK